MRMAEEIRGLGKLQRLAVMHSNCPECVTDLLGQIGDVLPAEPPLTVDVTPVIGTHVGPHAMGIAALLAD
jgi:fatty acid-binding protein DegV